jgi:hypothetical protein
VLKAAKTSEDTARHHSALFQIAAERHESSVVVSASSFAYLAWRVRKVGGPKATAVGYGMAGCLTLGYIPFALLVIEPTNKTILSKVAEAERGEKVDGQEISMLVGKLVGLNIVGSIFPMVGAMVCLMVAVGI